MKRKVLAVVLTAVMAMSGFSALSAAALSGSVYTAGVTKYLWRGQVLSDGFAIQPGLSLTAGGFSFGYWGSYHAFGGDMQYNESDYTVTYTQAVPYADFLSVKAGYTAYTFPYLSPAYNNSVEIIAGISSSVPSLPYLTFYYDAVQGKGGYLEGGVSHSLTFGDFGLSGALTAGYNYGQWLYEPSFTVLGVTLAGSYTIAGFVVSPSVFFQAALDDQYENAVTGSLSLTYNFSL